MKDADYIIQILIIGVGLGIGSFALGLGNNLEQSIIQHVLISLIIGYGILLTTYNYPKWLGKKTTLFRTKIILLVVFSLIAVIATMVDLFIRNIVFNHQSYDFSNEGGVFIFNIIIALIVGFGHDALINPKRQIEKTAIPANSQAALLNTELKEIPIRQGEITKLHQVEDIIFFEAYDNYSFLCDIESNRLLCNYPLSFLENRLANNFIRVHRKYIINKNQILQIQPHLKGRYILAFKDKNQTSIISSASYMNLIKSIIKL